MKSKSRLATAVNVALGSVLLMAVSGAFAQNAVRGKQLYESKVNPAYFSCGDQANGCHGPTPVPAVKNINKGTSPSVILAAINGGVPLMGPLRGFVTNTDAADIAAYIANPAAAAGAPVVSASATSFTFGTTLQGSTNTSSTPASVTLTNTGTANLTISAINKSGTNAADFTAGGTCVSGSPVTVAPNASCTVTATFTPQGTGARTATLTVASNAASNPAISLSGTGSTVPVPAISLNPTSLAFTAQTVGTTSAARTVTLTNSGSGALTITQLASANPEFAATSNCVGTIAVAGSCTISVTFTPTAANARSGTLTITSNAATSPSVALSGTGVLTASPIATIQSSAVAFPMTTVGVMSSGLSTTFSNAGNAPLQISGVTIGGANASEFRLGVANTCVVGTIAVGGSCQLEVAFQPQSAGTKTASVTIAHNATGGATTVAVTGSAATPAVSPSTGGTTTPTPAPSSSALAPSNVGGTGSLSLEQLMALALTLLLVPTVRRRLARR